MVIKAVAGNQCLGGFIGNSEAKKRSLAETITGWEESMETLPGVSCKHP